MIYLDYNATTPIDPRVLDVMLPFLRDRFGNAASGQHALGREAAEAVEHARQQVADAIGADPREIVWTSGATESDNLAILGVAASPNYASRRRVVTVKTEHKAVIDCCEELERQGYDVAYLPVNSEGMLDMNRLADAITDDTLLVTIMHANNETGVLHPIDEIGKLCKSRGVLFHTDATQSVGRESIDVQRSGIDLLSLSGHKFYAAKGVGALYVRRKGPRVRCSPRMHGGGHERGMRSGTLNVPAIVGIGEAVTIARDEMEAERDRIGGLRDRLEQQLQATLVGVSVNGHRERRLANTTNISIDGVDAARLIALMPGLAVSTSAACTSASRLPSYVLGAMGLSTERVRGSIRVSLGRFTRDEDLEQVVLCFKDGMQKLEGHHSEPNQELRTSDAGLP